MNWNDADRFCRDLGDGARLPTLEEYESLGRAMSQGGPYNPDRIADMSQNWFWSSSVHPYDPEPHLRIRSLDLPFSETIPN
ncbi:MAG: hypothetical protein ABIQ95_03565 [Bdellovibrionia bacterium]